MPDSLSSTQQKFKIILTLLIILLNTINCRSQNDRQSTKPENTVRDDIGKLFIEAVNSSSVDEQKEIIHKIFSEAALKEPGEEKLMGLIDAVKTNLGQAEYHSSEVAEITMGDGSSRSVMHLFAKSKDSKNWKDLQLILDPDDSGRILKLAFIAEVTEPVYLPNGSIEQSQTLEWLNNYVNRLQNKDSFYGSILIAKGSDIIFEKYAGYSNPETGTVFDNNTLFNMASGGKMFTAIAIAQLAEKGQIKLSDKVETYFPDFADKNKLNKVTIHHLLNHSSGIAEYWTINNTEAISEFTQTKEYLPLIYEAGFSFEPESEFGYSNSNYILLGLLVEKVSGQSFYDYVRQNIFLTAGMESTDYYTYGTAGIPLAIPLDRKENIWAETKHGIKGSPAGGCYSTNADMLKYSQSLKSNKLISAGMLSEITKEKTSGLKDATGYGYGFELYKYGREGISYGHGGMAGGVNFEYRYFPEFDITLIISCNQNNGAFDDLKKNAVKLITGDR